MVLTFILSFIYINYQLIRPFIEINKETLETFASRISELCTAHLYFSVCFALIRNNAQIRSIKQCLGSMAYLKEGLDMGLELESVLYSF